MERFFGMRRSHISSAIETFTSVLYDYCIRLLGNPALFQPKFPYYARLVYEKCGILDSVWGFIDGTLQKTCRLTYFQKRAYSGHKRCHGLKFQTVVTPDGLIACGFGPVNGNRHDSYMLAESNLLVQLQELMPRGEELYSLYGDPAYPQSRWIFGGYRNPIPGSPEAVWNTEMSKVREVVEWGFKDVVTQWSFLDFRPGMKVFLVPVSRYYMISLFLTNCQTTLYGNQTLLYFGARPPTLEEYLNLV